MPRGPMPDAVCGHSLGEFSALTAAGALEFREAVRLVKHRAQLMQDAVPVGIGAIAAVLGLEDEAIAAACGEAAQGEVVEAVNFNAPGQTVIAGHAEAVNRALAACKARGAKRAVLLPMSVPAHSSLMRPAAEKFAELLNGAQIAERKHRILEPRGLRRTSRRGGHPQTAAASAREPGALGRSHPAAARERAQRSSWSADRARCSRA